MSWLIVISLGGRFGACHCPSGQDQVAVGHCLDREAELNLGSPTGHARHDDASAPLLRSTLDGTEPDAASRKLGGRVSRRESVGEKRAHEILLGRRRQTLALGARL